ncbi:zinc-ribbon domain-containing protein [Subtercola frigoramans]|uniref:Very-short-patch-repair endonuclease n=1 Tax=Subtercola frigoramans TaxID=120298 RepID=A0ABS2L3F5_9MICO|nr:zinc-ribbon domain-containing protein [Subtercola frigoramans]MBM7471275.1 very-short-patch-repair endonuclease [Subtercola frigoramans]
MAENVQAWWSRRQRSKGRALPYEIGTYRGEWERYPVLIRQYHPELNHHITLTQIPPAAEVYLLWQCDTGHLFVATPEEQRSRPGRTRRRSSWCPECTELAVPRRKAYSRRATLPDRPARQAAPTPGSVSPGEAFVSPRAPRPSSAAEARLRQLLAERLEVDLSANAVKTSRPFFTHVEVWPDFVIPELRVAIEYDTVGRYGLEHVGKREETDRRKDRLLRAVGWEVVRIRCGKLQPLGPFDLTATAVSDRLIDRLLDALRDIRGDLIVNAYLAPIIPSRRQTGPQVALHPPLTAD